MTLRDLRNIHTTQNSCRDAVHALPNMALKLPWYFYLLMGKPLCCSFQVWSPYYQAATRKHLFLYPQSDRSGLRKPKKGKLQH